MATHRHLEPLLDGTPLAMERLKVAWPGPFELHVAGAMRDGAGEGLPYAPTPLWDDVVLAVYQPTYADDLFVPRFGCVASWLPPDVRASIPGQYAAFRFDPDQKTKSRGVEVEDYAHAVVIDSNLGVRLVGCNSSQAGGI